MDLVSLLARRFGPHEGYDAFDFLHAFGSPVECLMYLELLWPDFVEIGGAVLWSDAVDDESQVLRVLAQHAGDVAATEKAFNYVEFPYYFGNPDPRGELDVEGYESLGRRLCELWAARLHSLYPQRQFRVSFELDDDNMVITFHQV